MWFRGLGFRGLGCRGQGFRGLRCRVWGLGFRVLRHVRPALQTCGQARRAEDGDAGSTWGRLMAFVTW